MDSRQNRRAGRHFSRKLTPGTITQLQEQISSAEEVQELPTIERRTETATTPPRDATLSTTQSDEESFFSTKPSGVSAAPFQMGTRQAAGRGRPMSMQQPSVPSRAFCSPPSGSRVANAPLGQQRGREMMSMSESERNGVKDAKVVSDAFGSVVRGERSHSSGCEDSCDAMRSVRASIAVPSPTKRVSQIEREEEEARGVPTQRTMSPTYPTVERISPRQSNAVESNSTALTMVPMPHLVGSGASVPTLSTSQELAQDSAGQKVSKTVAEYELYKQRAQHRDFTDIAAMDIVHIAGKDKLGRPIIVALPANLPAKKVNLDDLMLYCITLLDPIVENDYVMVFVGTNASNDNRPTVAWLKKAYGIFNRKYKKNMKSLYIVHPNFWIKMTMKLCRPFISSKFWKKVVYVEDISTIYRTIDRDQIEFPDFVIRHNSKVNNRPPVFGATLVDVLHIEHSKTGVPEVVEKCISYLYSYTDVEGIFRKSGGAAYIEELKQSFNRGEDVDISEVDDPHAVCGLLKLFLRELADPVMTFDLYEGFVQTQIAMGKAEEMHWVSTVKSLLSNIPKVNLRVLKLLFDLAQAVVERADANLMTSSNLAIVFGPNLLKAREETLVSAMKDTPIVNSLVKKMIDCSSLLFGKPGDWDFMRAQYAVNGPGEAN